MRGFYQCFISNYRNNCYIFRTKTLKMKKIILLLAVAFAAVTVNAQTKKELIGRWKLASWTMKGKERIRNPAKLSYVLDENIYKNKMPIFSCIPEFTREDIVSS